MNSRISFYFLTDDITHYDYDTYIEEEVLVDDNGLCTSNRRRKSFLCVESNWNTKYFPI